MKVLISVGAKTQLWRALLAEFPWLQFHCIYVAYALRLQGDRPKVRGDGLCRAVQDEMEKHPNWVLTMAVVKDFIQQSDLTVVVCNGGNHRSPSVVEKCIKEHPSFDYIHTTLGKSSILTEAESYTENHLRRFLTDFEPYLQTHPRPQIPYFNRAYRMRTGWAGDNNMPWAGTYIQGDILFVVSNGIGFRINKWWKGIVFTSLGEYRSDSLMYYHDSELEAIGDEPTELRKWFDMVMNEITHGSEKCCRATMAGVRRR